jgi:MFS transporter, DHA1 family, inner membrane transport protein
LLNLKEIKMETEQRLTNEVSWTWADQISSYKFWGIFLFLIFLVIPNIIVSYSYSIFKDDFGMSTIEFGTAMAVKGFAGFGGFWLAWLMVRLKNHYLLFLYSSFTIIGLLLILLFPSIISISIGFFLIGLSFGAISLAIPAIISGGKGGSEMFIVSFGLISFYEFAAWTSFGGLFGSLSEILNNPKAYVIIGLVSSFIGTVLLLPVKVELFNNHPPVRKSFLTPTHREPVIVALLCLIPIYNIYYILHLSYRLHGEVNEINPTQDILSPRAAVWCTLLLFVLSPIIVSSLNTNLTTKLKENNANRFYKNWAIILWSFIFIPISYALIQSNMNKLLQNHSNNI